MMLMLMMLMMMRKEQVAMLMMLIMMILVMLMMMRKEEVPTFFVRHSDGHTNGASLFAVIVAQALLTTRTTCHKSHSADI